MITHHPEVIQGSDEWYDLRRGTLTASEMHLIISPKLKTLSNDKEKTHLFELLAQRANKYVEPQYVSDSMLRGKDEEICARAMYAEKYAPVEESGFVTNDEWGFKIGYSPDGLVGKHGQIECKSRMQKHQTRTIIEGVLPDEYLIQVHTGLLVTGREWCDFVSYCGGMPMWVLRVYPDDKIREAIVDAASAFEDRLEYNWRKYEDAIVGLFPTERKVEEEMII
jgi:predicted phage-related endonuclease